MDGVPDGYRPCVGLVLTNAAGLIWAGERVDNPGAWQMPQGGIDPGEDVRDAGLRELREETGLAPGAVRITAETEGWITYDLPPDLAARLWQGRFKGQAQRWLLLRYDGPDTGFDLDVHEREFTRWAWLDRDALMACIVPFKREVYETVLGAFAPHLEGA